MPAAVLFVLPLLVATVASAPADSVSRADSVRASARSQAVADSLRRSRRVVRQFPAVEVRELVHDLRSSQTVHVVPRSVLSGYPIDRLSDVLALQPGVVAEGEELHVRGGRSGETSVNLDGLRINEPLLHRALDVPLLALRDAELVSGAPDAQFGGGLAGTLELRTITPTERFALEPAARFSTEWRWQTDGRLGTHYDRAALRVSAPLAFGLAMVTAGDATLDDTSLPALRTVSRRRIAGMSFGWRAENRLNGFLKLAPVANPERFSAEVLMNRQVHRPYNPSFTVDGWMLVPANLKLSPIYSPVPLPGYQRYRAADHLGFTDDHQFAALVRVGRSSTTRRAGLGLGWLRTRTLTSVGGHRESESASHRPRYGSPLDRDRFHVLWGDDPVYRESGSDVFTLQGDAETIVRTGRMKAGFGVSYETCRCWRWTGCRSRSARARRDSRFRSIRFASTKRRRRLASRTFKGAGSPEA